MKCFDHGDKNMNKYLVNGLIAAAIAALIYYCYVKRSDDLVDPEVIPEVAIIEECEPEIVTIPVERVVEKKIYVEKKLKPGCHVDKDGMIYGVVPYGQGYGIKCYVKNGKVREQYFLIEGATLSNP